MSNYPVFCAHWVFAFAKNLSCLCKLGYINVSYCPQSEHKSYWTLPVLDTSESAGGTQYAE